ncbi:unnamed protein product, partial [marine sediment metagenome]
TELGAGFAIAMRDLEIRGAGNLLGVEQSGYIAAVGFDLYCRLLAEAVEEVKQKRAGEGKRSILRPPASAIALPATAYIPEDYISATSTRLAFYQRLSVAKQAEEIEGIARELSDRFGPVPQPVKNLLYVVEIKQLTAEQLGVEEESIVPSASLVVDLNIAPADLAELVTAIEQEFSTPRRKLEISDEDTQKIVAVQDLIDYLHDYGIGD